MSRLIFSIPLLAAVIFVAGCTGSTARNSTPNSSVTSGGMLFSGTPEYRYAHLISGDQLSADAQEAISGFSWNRTMDADGTVHVTLKALSPNYSDQSYTLQSGQSLYFIERSLGDDTHDNDGTLSDDTAVVVDANGYVVGP